MSGVWRAGIALALLVAIAGCRVDVILDEPPDAGYSPDSDIIQVDADLSGDALGDPLDAGPGDLPDGGAK